jgi:hypothetical protein
VFDARGKIVVGMVDRNQSSSILEIQNPPTTRGLLHSQEMIFSTHLLAAKLSPFVESKGSFQLRFAESVRNAKFSPWLLSIMAGRSTDLASA